MNYYYVLYTVMAGETHVKGKILIESQKDEMDAVHAHFSDYWGEKTEWEERGLSYNEHTGLEAIKIEKVQVVPVEEAKILGKYIGTFVA